MILIDRSIWVDHLRAGNAALAAFARCREGSGGARSSSANLRWTRKAVLTALLDLPSSIVATDAEVLGFMDPHALFGRGVGHVDVHLLASARLTGGAELWTSDRRLRDVADALGVAMAGRGKV